MRKIEISIFLGLILSLILTAFSQTNITASAVRNQTLRLHIIAQSNADADQDIKILVRDKVLVLANDILSSSSDINSAINIASQNCEYIQTEVNDFLKEQGVDYTATVAVENFYFDTTSYDNFTLPKGEYPALTVYLGSATGDNWWCVVYPSLCVLPSSGEYECDYEDKEIDTFVKEDDIEIKFKSVEIFEDIKEWVLGEDNIVYDKT